MDSVLVEYKTKIEKLINEAREKGLKVTTYAKTIQNTKEIIESGISLSDEKNRINITLYKDISVEILENEK